MDAPLSFMKTDRVLVAQHFGNLLLLAQLSKLGDDGRWREPRFVLAQLVEDEAALAMGDGEGKTVTASAAGSVGKCDISDSADRSALMGPEVGAALYHIAGNEIGQVLAKDVQILGPCPRRILGQCLVDH